MNLYSVLPEEVKVSLTCSAAFVIFYSVPKLPHSLDSSYHSSDNFPYSSMLCIDTHATVHEHCLT